jgi:hypothetical protein
MKRTTRKVKYDSTEGDYGGKIYEQSINSTRMNAVNNLGSNVVPKNAVYKEKEKQRTISII